MGSFPEGRVKESLDSEEISCPVLKTAKLNFSKLFANGFFW